MTRRSIPAPHAPTRPPRAPNRRARPTSPESNPVIGCSVRAPHLPKWFPERAKGGARRPCSVVVAFLVLSASALLQHRPRERSEARVLSRGSCFALAPKMEFLTSSIHAGTSQAMTKIILLCSQSTTELSLLVTPLQNPACLLEVSEGVLTTTKASQILADCYK